MSKGRFFLLLATAGLLVASGIPAMALQGGNQGGQQGGANNPGGGGDGGANKPGKRICIILGSNEELCFYLKPPPARYFGGDCCWRKVIRKRLNINGQWRTVYVDKGQRCASASGVRQCARMSRR